MFLSLGQYDKSENRGQTPNTEQLLNRYRCTVMAVRYLTALRSEGTVGSALCEGWLSQAYQNRAFQNYYMPSSSVPVNMDFACSLRLCNDIPDQFLADENVREFVFQRLQTLFLAGQADAGLSAMLNFMDHLPPVVRVHPPAKYFDLRIDIAEQVGRSRLEADKIKSLPLAERAAQLANDPKIGLIDKAIEELQAAMPLAGPDMMTLGDLMLRKGQSGRARGVYAAVELPKSEQWKLGLRLALCDWADGKLHVAAKSLATLGDFCNEPLVRFYQADLLELIGNYKEARAAIEGVTTSDQQIQDLINRLKLRLPRN